MKGIVLTKCSRMWWVNTASSIRLKRGVPSLTSGGQLKGTWGRRKLARPTVEGSGTSRTLRRICGLPVKRKTGLHLQLVPMVAMIPTVGATRKFLSPGWIARMDTLRSTHIQLQAAAKQMVIHCTQLSNLWWMPNSVSKGFDTAIKMGSSTNQMISHNL